jgi:pimeloyl-ACP methyl ester carboxylesterase
MFKKMFAVLITLVGALALLPTTAGAKSVTHVKNVVLVHGAFADGSGWRAVYDSLIAKGYKVTMVQIPETSLEDDVAATKRALDLQDGPTVLVGHSWGGQVITDAGADPKVVSLVYLAAIVPDVGESTDMLENGKFPQPNGDVKETADHFYYMDPAKFQENFAADSPKALADFMAASQVPLSVKGFKTPAKAAPWKTKPTWAVLPLADKTVSMDLQRWMYARAHAKVTEVPGSSHTVYLSHPDVVVKVIESASNPD